MRGIEIFLPYYCGFESTTSEELLSILRKREHTYSMYRSCILRTQASRITNKDLYWVNGVRCVKWNNLARLRNGEWRWAKIGQSACYRQFGRKSVVLLKSCWGQHIIGTTMESLSDFKTHNSCCHAEENLRHIQSDPKLGLVLASVRSTASTCSEIWSLLVRWCLFLRPLLYAQRPLREIDPTNQGTNQEIFYKTGIVIKYPQYCA